MAGGMKLTGEHEKGPTGHGRANGKHRDGAEITANSLRRFSLAGNGRRRNGALQVVGSS